MHTLPLSHAPRRESGAPHRFPGPARRAALHPRVGVLMNTCFLDKRNKEAPREQAGSGPGVRVLGVAQRPRTHASAPGGPPKPPLCSPSPILVHGKNGFFTDNDSLTLKQFTPPQTSESHPAHRLKWQSISSGSPLMLQRLLVQLFTEFIIISLNTVNTYSVACQ